jgi:chaperonin GroEL
MFKLGIIDPTKVVRTEIVAAGRIASLMLTTEAMVIDEPEDTGNNHEGHGHMH